MANSIYLYTVNKIPTVAGGEGFTNVDAKALYQYPVTTTVVSDILTGARFIKQTPSILWNETTAAVSDFNEGVKLLTATLPTLVELMKGSKLILDRSMLQNMQTVLNKQRGKFILTEMTDLSSQKKFKAKQINKLNLEVSKNAAKFATEVRKAINQRKDKKRITEFIRVLQKYKKTNNKDMGLLGFTGSTDYGP